MVEKTYEDYSGIEEYPNAFDKDFCQEVIRHFETLDDNRVINANRQGHGFVTDDRIVFDWAHTQGVYHYDFKRRSRWTRSGKGWTRRRVR